MFAFESMWQVYEFKLVVLFITGIIAVVLGNYIHNKMKEK